MISDLGLNIQSDEDLLFIYALYYAINMKVSDGSSVVNIDYAYRRVTYLIDASDNFRQDTRLIRVTESMYSIGDAKYHLPKKIIT